jgi:pyruvate dehydrogenase E2 component (dihydrolipoamide acetyltransferase)
MVDDRIATVVMPKWGLSMTEGTITKWFVAEGDTVAVGDELAEIETEKSVGPLECRAAGVLRRIVAPVGVTRPVGASLAVVAPAEVADADIDAVVAEAEAQLASGELEQEAGPITGTVEVGGRTLAYQRVGEGSGEDAGEPIVLIHGFGGDATSWLLVMEPLAADRTVYAVELPGHGGSTKDVGDGFDTLVGAVVGFLDAEGVARVHLAGHSLGGAVVTAVAAGAPDRVASLTLVAPAGFGSEANAAYLRGFAAATDRRSLRSVLGDLFASDGAVTRQMVDDILRYKRLDGVPASLDALLGVLLDNERQALDLTERAGSYPGPATVVWGRADAVLPADHAKAAADALSGAGEPVVVEGAGHMPHLEQAPAVVAAIEATIARA